LFATMAGLTLGFPFVISALFETSGLRAGGALAKGVSESEARTEPSRSGAFQSAVSSFQTAVSCGHSSLPTGRASSVHRQMEFWNKTNAIVLSARRETLHRSLVSGVIL